MIKSKNIFFAVSMTCLIMINMLVPSLCLATDSTGLPIVNISSSSFATVSGTFPDMVTAPGTSVGVPKQMTLSNGVSYIAKIPYDGNYFYQVTLNWRAAGNGSNLPTNLWVDAWASTPDLQGNSRDIRMFYTGEKPLTLTQPSPFIFTFYLQGSVYLKKGAYVFLPRIWTDSGNAATFYINGSYTLFYMSQ